MTTPTDIHPLYFMGRKIGTYNSVDIYPETGMKFYDYKPGEGSKIPPGTIFIDMGRGTAKLHLKGQEPSEPIDVIDAISACPKFSEAEFAQEEALIDAEEEAQGDDED